MMDIIEAMRAPLFYGFLGGIVVWATFFLVGMKGGIFIDRPSKAEKRLASLKPVTKDFPYVYSDLKARQIRRFKDGAK